MVLRHTRGETNEAEILPMGTPPVGTSTPNTTTDLIPIFNLSNHDLSPSQVSLLKKGLSFVPTERTNFLDLQAELLRFFRSIRLKAFFKDNIYMGNPDATGLRPPSTFLPAGSKVPVEVLTFEKMVLKDLTTIQNTFQFVPYNISLDERKALNELKSETNLIIKPADKGGGIVLQNRDDYTSEILQQLNNTEHYIRLPKDPTSDIQSEIQKLTSAGRDSGFLSKN